ncbi:hypothetical protein CVT26_002886 [Gymnopilus dilepis]|uniref:Protein MGR2 n=1 Tax=Gymnopilus dilepis TaxID=231916 RepID=A0A409W2D3_9AGAR|nr:hypothetical protein CVT26_002886 [Gymnopilus dilepis]
MPPPPGSFGGHAEGPSIWQKSTLTSCFILSPGHNVNFLFVVFYQRMGAIMGGGVGLTIGFIFGSWSIIRGGAGPRGALSTLSQYMLSSAATFSFFLAIGSVIRSDAMPAHLQAAQLQLASSVQTHARAEGLQIMRAAWEAERRKLASKKQ